MKIWIGTGALLLALAVILGAMGSHFFSEELELAGGKERFFRAHFYLVVHALGLILFGIIRKGKEGFRNQLTPIFFVLGILLFCGTLFLTSIGSIEFGLLAPFGGLAFILGWSIMGIQEFLEK